ncbi:MAG: GPGG-motif small membrane protein [Ilumatobacteraceae bacterium]
MKKQYSLGIAGILGIVQLVQDQIIFGVDLIVAGRLVGPGGYSVCRIDADR